MDPNDSLLNRRNLNNNNLSSSGEQLIETPGPLISQFYSSQQKMLSNQQIQFKEIQPKAVFHPLWIDTETKPEDRNAKENLEENGKNKWDKLSFMRNRTDDSSKEKKKNFPSIRYGASLNVHPQSKDIVYIYGGMDNAMNFLEDLYEFNVTSKKWRVMPLQGILRSDPKSFPQELTPKGRHFHVSWIYDNYFWIYAGKSNGYQADLWRYSLEYQEWEYVPSTGRRPSPRYGLAGSLAKDKFYVIGGYDNSGSKCDDIYQLDLLKMEWTELRPKIGRPPPLHHSTLSYYNGSLYVFVGEELTLNVYEFRLTTLVWAPVQVLRGIPPASRKGHSVVLLGHKFFILGGTDLSCSYSDLVIFDLENLSWERKIIEGMTARHFHAADVSNQRMIVFGGTNMSHFFFNDIYTHDLSHWTPIYQNTFSSDMANLLQSEQFTDITFIFEKENKTIQCHKAILASRSELYSKMFSSSMRESHTGQIKMDSSYNIFKLFLGYLYTGEIRESGLDAEVALELLSLAESHFLRHLKSFLENFLIRFVTLDNVVSLYSSAQTLNAKQLEENCFVFMLKNYSSLQEFTPETPLPSNLEIKLKKYLKL